MFFAGCLSFSFLLYMATNWEITSALKARKTVSRFTRTVNVLSGGIFALLLFIIIAALLKKAGLG